MTAIMVLPISCPPLLSSSFLARGSGTPRSPSCPAMAPLRSTSRTTCCSASSSANRSVRLAVLLPLAACAVLAASPPQADAGILSGSSGLESIQLPSVPEPGFLKQIQEDKKKMYEGFDAKFKSSSYLQELLQKSKDNAAMHKKEIADKYCERGAEWGVGDCSLVGMSQEEREAFMKVLKQK